MTKDVTQFWLDFQCKQIPGICRAIVMLADQETGAYVPVASWPDEFEDNAGFSRAGEMAVDKQRLVIQAAQGSHDQTGQRHLILACPLMLENQLAGVIALEVPHRSEQQILSLKKVLAWGSTWLDYMLRQQSSATPETPLVTVLDFVTTCLEHGGFQGAATAVATELATRFSCERVAIGFHNGKHAQVQALSHSAQYDKRSNLIREIGMAMDEALDQQRTLVYPAAKQKTAYVLRAHEDLAKRQGAGAICTIPLTDNGVLIGALTLERPAEQPFDKGTVEFCQHIASLAGPLLEVKRRDDRWLLAKVGDACGQQLRKIFGPGHTLFKLGSAAALVLFVFMTVATGDYRVAANATVEAEVQRALVAPMKGFISIASVRAGDLVKQGDILVSLEDKDLKLEFMKWSSQRDQMQKEYRSAMALHDRAQVSILSAQLSQAVAQIELLEQQLARTQLSAPFDGIVVKGDLSQSLGSPVERGDILFEVAPLDAYRVILKVDEREIGDIQPGQKGQLALSAMAGETLSVTIEKITPVSTTKEGSNFFRVEASLDEPSVQIRPGMEGVGKIVIDQRSLIWIWTHKLVDWLRLWFWSWWP